MPLYKIAHQTSDPNVFTPYIARGTGIHYRLGRKFENGTPLFVYETFAEAYRNAAPLYEEPLVILEGTSSSTPETMPLFGLDFFDEKYSEAEVKAFWRQVSEASYSMLREKYGQLMRLAYEGKVVSDFLPVRSVTDLSQAGR